MTSFFPSSANRNHAHSTCLLQRGIKVKTTADVFKFMSSSVMFYKLSLGSVFTRHVKRCIWYFFFILKRLPFRFHYVFNFPLQTIMQLLWLQQTVVTLVCQNLDLSLIQVCAKGIFRLYLKKSWQANWFTTMVCALKWHFTHYSFEFSGQKTSLVFFNTIFSTEW